MSPQGPKSIYYSHLSMVAYNYMVLLTFNIMLNVEKKSLSKMHIVHAASFRDANFNEMLSKMWMSDEQDKTTEESCYLRNYLFMLNGGKWQS